ncbi:MAG: serine acetyltransferase [Deltaproteobacteria bacterium]|nr:serine acetyltransferase [Deltaproteobacteria bacterium]
MFDQVRADYHRHGRSLLNPALWAMVVYRFGRWSLARRTRAARWVTSKVYGLLFLGVELATGITLNREAIVGEGFHLVHSGNIKVHPGVVIGDRVGLMHDVTLGTNMGRGGVPQLGNDVFIGAGAKILGAVTIGDGARVAANSLVVSDVPPGATAIGVPARVMRYTGRAPEAGEGSVRSEETVAEPSA